MKLVIPMAGRGSRLRPHTLTTPKPLMPIAGKPIVHRLAEDIAQICGEQLEEIVFVVGDFGDEVSEQLLSIANKLGAKGKVVPQGKPMGTAHAVLCAEDSLEGPVIVAFADTLFKADFTINPEDDGILWVKQIEDPSAFGVVKLDDNGVIVDYVEKPQEFVSDLAMIGIYYFKDGAHLRKELNYLVDNNIIKGDEYQLPDALRNMTNQGVKFKTAKVDQWMDCGNKNVTVQTNSQVLQNLAGENLVDKDATIENALIIPPTFVDKGVTIKNAIVGPGVSISSGTVIENSIIKDSIIQEDALIQNANLDNSIVGIKAKVESTPADLSISDYSVVKL